MYILASAVLFASKFNFCDVPVSIVPFRNHYLHFGIPAKYSRMFEIKALSVSL